MSVQQRMTIGKVKIVKLLLLLLLLLLILIVVAEMSADDVMGEVVVTDVRAGYHVGAGWDVRAGRKI